MFVYGERVNLQISISYLKFVSHPLTPFSSLFVFRHILKDQGLTRLDRRDTFSVRVRRLVTFHQLLALEISTLSSTQTVVVCCLHCHCLGMFNVGI